MDMRIAKWCLGMLAACGLLFGSAMAARAGSADVTACARKGDTHGKVQLWEGGPYWAETNIGAEKEWEYGLYFWWGDTVGEEADKFKHDENHMWSADWLTADGVLAPEHDAAHVQWGGAWRMPTDQELKDLCDKCEWTWTTRNDVNGCEVRGCEVRGKGKYDSFHIFLPAADFCYVGHNAEPGDWGHYWSSVPNPGRDSAVNALVGVLRFSTHNNVVYPAVVNLHPLYGRSIRPVQGGADIIVRLHGNGMVTTDGATTVDIPYKFGEAQQLENPFVCTPPDDQAPLSIAGETGWLKGWSVGTCAFDWTNTKDKETLLPPRKNLIIMDSDRDWIYNRTVPENGGKVLHLYAIWNSKVKVNMLGKEGNELSPASLKKYVQSKLSYDKMWHAGEWELRVPPGPHQLMAHTVSDYGDYAKRWTVRWKGAAGWNDGQIEENGEPYKFVVDDHGRPWEYIFEMLASGVAEVAPVWFSYTSRMTAEQAAGLHDFPAFDADKVSIQVWRTKGTWGDLDVTAEAGRRTVDLPAGSYEADFSYGDGDLSWIVFPNPKIRFTVEDGGAVTEVKGVYMPDGSDQYNSAWAESIRMLRQAQTTGAGGVRIPASVTAIAGGAFADCGSVMSVTFGGDAPVLESGALDGLAAGAVVRISRESSGWGEVPGTWQGHVLAYDSLAELPADASAEAVAAALAEVAMADGERVASVVDGSAAEYAAFREWARNAPDGEESVLASGHAASAYLLGAEGAIDEEPAGGVLGIAIAPAFGMSGGVDGWSFATGGDKPWCAQRLESHDGVSAVRSGTVGNGQASWLETEVTGPGTIIFLWNTSCEDIADGYADDGETGDGDGEEEIIRSFSVDGVPVAALSGVPDWEQVSCRVDGGTHVLRWTYQKGDSVAEGDDCVWVDELTWIPAVTEQEVAFNAAGGTCGTAAKTYAVGVAYGVLPTPKWAGHAWLGWYTEASGGTEVTVESEVTEEATRTLYAQWTEQQVTTFLGNGGKPSAQATTNTIYAKYGTLPTPKWTGHVFLGWFNAPEGGKRVYTNSTVTLAAERTLYAQWTDQQVTTFKANGGYPSTQKTTNTIYADYGTFPAVKYSGHALVGWFNAPEGGKRVYTNSTVTLAAARTLYAQWTTNQVTTFKGNGGTPEIQKTTNAIYTHYGTLPEAAWENHVFLGWFNHPTKGKRVYTNSTVTLAATRSLYAHWTDKQVTTFKGNGGTPKTQATTNTMGTAYGTLPTPKKSGYALLGWFTAADGGSEVTAADIVPVGTSRTLYAHWTDQQVTTFLGNGGTPETQATTNTIYAKYAFPPTPAWDGHTFRGWYNAAEGGKRVYTNSTVTLAATRTLYAHWTTGKGFAITAIAVGSSDGDEGPAPRAVRGEDRAENVCRLRFELSEGTEYEIQWTASLDGEWETVERLKAETDGEVEVEIEVPGGETGFFRLVTSGDAGKSD